MSTSSPAPTLDGAYLKLRRAHGHLEALWDGILPFLKPYANLPITDLRGDFFHVDAPDLPDTPPEFGVLLGDFLHNARSALDYLVFELAKLDAGKEVEQTQFPIFDDCNRYIRDGKWRLKHLSTLHKARIEALQPYQRGNRAAKHLLSVLSKLSNQDKHKLLVPTTHRVIVGRHGTATRRDGGTLFIFDLQALKEETEAALSGAPVEVQPQLEFVVTLEDGTKLRVMRRIGRVVNLILDDFASEFPAPNVDPLLPDDWEWRQIRLT